MDMQLAKSGYDFSRKRKRWLFIAAALGFSGFGAYRFYHSPSVSQKRKRILRLLGALVSVVEVVSDSAETIGVVSKDLKDFLQSDSDQIPNSLRQVSKIARSDEVSGAVVQVTHALTLGVLRGYRSQARADGDSGESSFADSVMDKLFTKAGSGFASVIVGSFARNLVLGFYSDELKSGGVSNSRDSARMDRSGSEMNDVPKWMNVVCDEKCRDLLGDWIQLFVSTAVSVYLDKTMSINTYDDIFSGLTNPKHEKKARDLLTSICNGAVETVIRTSHQLSTNSTSKEKPSSDLNSTSYLAIHESSPPARDEGSRQLALSMRSKATNVDDDRKDSWVGKVSSTLAVPRNRRFVLDVTGKVTSETVRSFLGFLSERVFDGVKGCANSVREETVDRGHEIVRHAVRKSSIVATICLSLCLHIIESPWALVPP